MEFNKEKFKKVLHYLISECGTKDNVGKTVFYKLLYFADFNFFELYETPLTNESYRKLPYGPAPIHFEEAIKELSNEGKIDVELVPSYYNDRFIYTSLKEPEVDFTKDELGVIKEVLKLSDMNATQISAYSHGDMPWRAAKEYDIMKYSFVFYRDPKYSVRSYDDTN